MAGDIFFTEDRVWMTNSNTFVDFIARATARCRAGEEQLVQLLCEAESIRCLDIDLVEDRRLKIALTERVMEAAEDQLSEWLKDPEIHPDSLAHIGELVSMARAHRGELRSHPS